MPEKLFGALREPVVPAYREGEAILSHEISAVPESMMALNQENGARIKRFFDAAVEGEVLKGFYENILLIYVVDTQGDILLAIEELFRQKDIGISSGIARLVRHQPHRELPKLGHPALLPLGDKESRLAGEIFYEDGVWYINDHSGRYTRQGSDNTRYLNNVIERFLRFEIEIIMATE